MGEPAVQGLGKGKGKTAVTQRRRTVPVLPQSALESEDSGSDFQLDDEELEAESDEMEVEDEEVEDFVADATTQRKRAVPTKGLSGKSVRGAATTLTLSY